jgi:uncharacterized zinc-type alcohol dehydrogenase-like protein
MLTTKAYGVQSTTSPLAPLSIQRRDPGQHDVLVDILYCGICHTDIDFSRGQFPKRPPKVFGHETVALGPFPTPSFPRVPGHEIVGKVALVGNAVTKHKVGDLVAVGCVLDTCGTCPECKAGVEQYCNGISFMLISMDKDGKTPNHGGYSKQIVAGENYVLKVSPKLSLAGVAPMVCGGITIYSPLRHWKVGKGSKVGIIGLGGIGHLGVKFAVAMGADVTVLSTSSTKQADAKSLGASGFAVTTNADTFTRLAGHFDLIISTVSANIDYDGYISLLKYDGALVPIGLSDDPVSFNIIGLRMKRRSVSSSRAGSIRETQEMLNFCAEHGIVSEIEMTTIDKVDEAYERILRSDVRYRFVIDMASLH